MRTKLLKLLNWLLGLNHRRLLELLDWPIRLPVDIMLVAPDYGNMSRLPVITDAIEASEQFWQEQFGIYLQVSLRGVQSDMLPTEVYPTPYRQLHHWAGSGRTPAVYIWSDMQRVGNDFLGQAFTEHGIVVVAGNPFQFRQEKLLDEVVDHELVHLLGLEHQEGTFMAAELVEHNRVVTKEQRAKVREMAYRLGSL